MEAFKQVEAGAGGCLTSDAAQTYNRRPRSFLWHCWCESLLLKSGRSWSLMSTGIHRHKNHKGACSRRHLHSACRLPLSTFSSIQAPTLLDSSTYIQDETLPTSPSQLTNPHAHWKHPEHLQNRDFLIFSMSLYPVKFGNKINNHTS